MHSPEHRTYKRLFICPDVNNFWLVRILKGFDEDYEEDNDSYILERTGLYMEVKGQSLNCLLLKELLLEDDFINWDMYVSYDLKELLDRVDDGYGILNLKEDLK